MLYPDGTGVDKQESDDVLYVQDVQTGELFTIAPNRISELAEATDPQTVIAEREEAIAAATNQEIEQEEGAASGTAAPTEAPEVRIPAPRFSGARVTLDLPNGSSVNGVVLQETDDGVEVQTDSPVNGRFVQVFPTDEFDGMLSSVRDEADDVIWSREVAGPVDVEEENQNDAAANGQQREMQGNGIPVDAKTGEPVYEAVAPDVAWDAIVQEAEGDEAMAMQVVTDMVADMEAKVQKAKKAKVRAGSTVRERLEAQKKHKRRIEEAEAQLEAWRRIAAVKAERIAAAERAKIEAAQQREVTQDDETEVPDFVFDKPENARERGYRMQNGQRADRQEPIAAAVGKEVSVKFTNKVSQPVRVAVVDARSLQPSHQNGQPNVLHFLPEAQPKKRTDHESVHAAEQMAAQMNPEEITSSVTAYTGAPSVNARGEVIQGNNRTAALKRMWQGYPEQAAAYKQYLMDHASEYGLNPEDIAAMEQPVLVNLMDVTDEQAIELGQYDVKDTESGGTERIKPRNVSQKMGDKAERFASILLRTTDEDASVSQLIDEHAVETLKWLEAQHYISPTQYRSAFNAEGEVTTEAKNDLRGILYQAVFKNGSERLEDMFNALPAKAQRAILATAYRDFATPESEKMLPEIQNSIVAFYELSQDAAFANAKNFEEARKATMAWLQQMQFDFSTGQSVSREGKYTNFALTLAAMYKVQTQTAIQQTFNEMFDLLQGRQQPDLYNPNPNNTPRTLAEAIREVLNIEYDGTNGSHALGGNNETRTTGRQGSARDDSAGEQPENQNESNDHPRRTERNRGQLRNDNKRSNDLPQITEISSAERTEMENRIVDWLSEENLSMAMGKTRDEIFEIFGNEVLPIAYIPTKFINLIGSNIKDQRIYCGKGYFIDHALRNHAKSGMQISAADVDVSKYLNIQAVLDNPDSIKETFVDGKRTVVFIKRIGRYFAELTQIEEGGKIVLHKSFFNQKKEPYAKLNDIRENETSSEGGISSISHAENQSAPAISLQSRGDVVSISNTTGKDTPQNSAVQTSGQENAETSLQSEVTRAEQQTNAEPTEGQKEAGNYKKGRVKVGPFDVVIEQPRGSVRSGVDANGKAWETTMQNTYGYFGGTKGVDGDAIDVFLGNDLDGWDGTTVFVVDQYNPDGSFDEHKVMLGFNSQEEAEAAYFANYEADWAKTHRTEVTAVPLADFTEWVKSSKRKTKAFAEYKVAKRNAEIDAHNAQNEQLAEQLFSMAKEAETEKDFFDRAASLFEVTGYQSDLRDIYNGVKSGEIANVRALSFYTNATLKPVKAGVKVKAPKSEQKQKAEAPRQSGYERKHWHADSSLEEMLAREKYLQNAMSFGTKEMAEVFPMAEEWQRDREELKAKYGDDLKNALPNDVKNAFLKKHKNTFANQTALNDELYELRSAIISHKEKAASRAEAAAKEQKAEEENKRFGDFLNGKTPLRRASIVKALTRVSNFGKEGSMTMAQFIEKHVAEGTLELRTKEVDKLQGPSRRQLNRMDASQQAQAENRVKQAGKKTEYLINGFVANKTAYEYAEHLLATKNSKAGEKPRKHAAQPGASAVSTQEATLRDALVDVALQSGLEVVVDEKAQQALDEVNGRARTMAFGEEYDYDRYPEGRVEPNIADKYVHIERAKLDHGFANFNEAKEWAKSHIVRTLDNAESGGKGNVKISSTAVNKYLSESAVAKSDSKDVHLAVLKKLPEIIHDSVDVETTPDFKKDENGVRKVGNEINKNVLIHRCYGAVEINGNIYRVKITLKEYKDAVRDNKAYSYEATKIELLAGTLVGRDISSNPGTNNSISVAKLLKDVEMSYRPGVKVLEESAKQRARLREHRYFRTPSGEAYGFTVDGKIYLDPRIATAETPIHEYAHLWADMIRNVNAEAWNDIVGLMKATPIWEEVRGLYPELKTDDEIADEVLAHYSGRRGAERLREAQQHAAAETGKSVFERAAAVAAIERVKQALAKFWQSVAELFHIRFTSAEEVADRVLADMLNGVNPNKYIKRKGKGVQKLHLNDKTLAGIHNITEEKLRKALNLGGLANPSLARNYKALGGEVEARNVQNRLHMTPEERRQSLAEETEDVAREDQIFIMENVGKADSLGDSSSFDEHQNEDLKAVNERFNEQLGILTEKNADSMVFSLGRPSVVLQSAGVMNKPMKLYGNKVMKKMRKHGFALEELRDLPRAVADPIAVFNNYGEDGNRSILTELRTQQGNFLVTLSTGVDQDVDFNIVRSVFGKGDENVLDWINKGLATYINKEKALSFLSYQSAPIAATAANAGQSSKGLSSASQPVQQEIDKLDTATKVVKDFVNPQLSEENKFRQGASATTSSRPTVANLQAHAAKIVERLHLTNVEIVTDALQLEGKQRTAKGFYNKRTGKITIVLPNHASTADVEQTLLHEAVAHYGLRQLFGEHFDDFLDMVYRNAEEGIRRKIAEASAKHGWNVRTATEEYLADLAERTDFEHASPQWWAKIKGFFLDMLRGLGFEAMDGQTLTDNELRYVLWRSYENLTEPGKYPTFIAEARDVAKQHALQVGRFAPTETAGSRVAENEALSEEETAEILFRDGNDYQYTQALARDRYERRIKSGMYQTQEALQDSMLGLRTAMESILEAEGRKGVYIEDIDGFENAYLGENRLSSVNQAEAEKFSREQFKVSSKKVCGCNIWVRQNVVASYVLVIGKR